jgi:carbon storage regulator
MTTATAGESPVCPTGIHYREMTGCTCGQFPRKSLRQPPIAECPGQADDLPCQSGEESGHADFPICLISLIVTAACVRRRERIRGPIDCSPVVGEGRVRTKVRGAIAMLVLTRKKFQRILIGDSIELKVLEIRGGKVKLGFQCPPEISIRREEVDATFHAAVSTPAEQSEYVLSAM